MWVCRPCEMQSSLQKKSFNVTHLSSTSRPFRTAEPNEEVNPQLAACFLPPQGPGRRCRH